MLESKFKITLRFLTVGHVPLKRAAPWPEPNWYCANVMFQLNIFWYFNLKLQQLVIQSNLLCLYQDNYCFILKIYNLILINYTFLKHVL